MDKDNQMGRLLIDIDQLKDSLQEKEAELTEVTESQNVCRDEVARMMHIISAKESEVGGLLNDLDRLGS